MPGWRARIGLLLAQPTFLDDEYWKMVPKGVSLLITRHDMPSDDVTVPVIESCASSDEPENSAKVLVITKPHVIAYACTAVSFIRGVGGDLDIIRRIEKATGIPATTTSTAAVAALRHLNVKNLAVITPYPDEVNEALKRFLQGSGFNVTRISGLQHRYGVEIGDVQPETLYRLGRDVVKEEDEALFISCTGLRTLDILEPLEEDLGKPVVTANQATIWMALRMAKVNAQVSGCGRLMRS